MNVTVVVTTCCTLTDLDVDLDVDDTFPLLGDSTYRTLHSGEGYGDRTTVALRGELVAGECAAYGGGGRICPAEPDVLADNGADTGDGG